MFVMAFTTTKAFADFGWYDGSMSIGGVTTDPTTWSSDSENPTDLGIVCNMTITSIAFKIWSDTNNRAGANMYFRIWDGGASQVGSDQDLHLGSATRITGDHNFSVFWTGTLNLATAVGLTLEAGKTYYIDMYAKTYGGDPNVDEWYSNYSKNFHAKLTYNYTRSVTEGNFGTICLPFGATISEDDATIYEITGKVMESEVFQGINIGEVAKAEGNYTLTAGKPYIFKANNTSISATLSGNYTSATANNGLIGNLAAANIKAPVGSYVIGGDNYIHQVVNPAEGEANVTVGQYKAYIDISGIVAAAPGLNFIPFFDNELSGINTIEASKSKANRYFNLNGQRVAQPTKGLYIVNGKKVVLK